MQIPEILTLTEEQPDVFVGTGPRYPWGGLYGGQIVAQAFRAATSTVERDYVAHSLRAYFIRRGDQDEPVRYEVDRIRDGRSFATRRVVARQVRGAILNLEASFHVDEPSENFETVTAPSVPHPDELTERAWSRAFESRHVPVESMGTSVRAGAGRAGLWMRSAADLGDDPVLHQAALAYLSDDLPTEAVVHAHPLGKEPEEVLHGALYSASLDHAIWFHRPMRADRWHLHDHTCQTFVGGLGLAIGHVFALDGTHVATVAQEVLLRDARRRDGS